MSPSRYLPLLFTAVAFVLPSLLSAHDQEEPVLPPELVEPAKAYAEKEEAIDEQASTQLQTAGSTYLDALAPIMEKLQKGSNPHELELAKDEITRFKDCGANSSPNDALPVGVKSAWKTYTKEEEKIAASFAPQRAALRLAYQKTLADIEKGYVSKKDIFAVGIIRRARAMTIIRTAVETNQIAILGGPVKPVAVTDIVHDGGYLVGIDFGQHEFHGNPGLGRAMPIYLSAKGQHDGKTGFGHGGSSGRITAKDGYAVGGINFRDHLTPGSYAVVGSIQLIYMKINPDGLTLDPKDTYTSDWVGGDGNGKAHEINAHGHVVVGMKNIPGDCIDAISLLTLK